MKALRKLRYRISVIRQLNPSNPAYRTMINDLDRDATRKLAALEHQTPGVALAWRNAAYTEADALETDYPHLFDTVQQPKKNKTPKKKPPTTSNTAPKNPRPDATRDHLASVLDNELTRVTEVKNTAVDKDQRKAASVHRNRVHNWRKQLPDMSEKKINELLHQLTNHI